jgi:ferritin-like metal-binding protein YciE
MERKNSNELLLEQLQRTLATERAVLAGLPKLAAGADAPAAQLDIYMQRTAERVHRLEQMPDVATLQPGAVETTIDVAIAELDELFSNAGRMEVRKAAATSAIEAVRQLLMARYTALSLWAMLVGNEELAKALFRTLDDVRMWQPPIDSAGQGREKRQMDISLGERLTAMFDRRK